MRLHGYDLEGFSQHCESFQQLHRKGRGKLGLKLSENSAFEVWGVVTCSIRML